MAWATLTRLERTLERWQSALFSRAHAHESVELVDALHHECDRQAVVCSEDRVVVPNAYEVELAADVYAELLGQGCGDVGVMLTDKIARHGRRKGYEWAGPLTVRVTAADLPAGAPYRVSSSPMPHVRADAFPAEG
ncbi:FhaA domain-containing protein [Streptomyces sp. NPDC053493]|uniref:FhaA domain-containing protein n=1 Tax=Streptomyces sp. NPDC053493 TaxID=3365705 RepID=UPI0037D23AE0